MILRTMKGICCRYRKFKEAPGTVPEPKHEWKAGAWLYASIGNMYFMLDDYEKCGKYFVMLS